MASPSEMFGWQVRCLDIYLFYVYEHDPTALWDASLPTLENVRLTVVGWRLEWLAAWRIVVSGVRRMNEV